MSLPAEGSSYHVACAASKQLRHSRFSHPAWTGSAVLVLFEFGAPGCQDDFAEVPDRVSPAAVCSLGRAWRCCAVFRPIRSRNLRLDWDICLRLITHPRSNHMVARLITIAIIIFFIFIFIIITMQLPLASTVIDVISTSRDISEDSTGGDCNCTGEAAR